MRAVIDAVLAQQSCAAKAERWGLPLSRLADAIEGSLPRLCGVSSPSAVDVARTIAALHLDDLVLACACADGLESAWDHFIREYRPVLYRAADAIDPHGGARDLADGLYAELFGLTERSGARRSHFRYYHGRSSLATWLRAVLAQRHVDRVRAVRRLDPLPADESAAALTSVATPADPNRARYLRVIRDALTEAVAALAPRDRLRLTCYYAHSLTLAQIGRAVGEHEATVSRHLTRTRAALRTAVEERLRTREGMTEATLVECFASVIADGGPLRLDDMLAVAADDRKNAEPDRSR
jgi:RNA polymerase sigma-70 factor (ECF subfamily)